jgi:uncharacterized phiE125 gp8 family phage protein
MANQNIKLVQIAGPTLSIVSVSEAKNYLKLGSDTTDDNLIAWLIKTATSIVERECGGLAICEQTWKQYQTGGVETIELLRQPVISTPTVSYYSDFDSTVETLTLNTDYRIVDNELYSYDNSFKEGRAGDGYTIEFKAGMFTSSNYTSSDRQELTAIKTLICRILAFLYENREEYLTNISEGTWKAVYDTQLPVGIKLMCMNFHTGKGLI